MKQHFWFPAAIPRLLHNTGLLSVEWQKLCEPRLGDNVDDEEDILDEYQYDSAEDVEDPDYDDLRIAEVEVDEKEDKAKKVWWGAGVVKCEVKGKWQECMR